MGYLTDLFESGHTPDFEPVGDTGQEVDRRIAEAMVLDANVAALAQMTSRGELTVEQAEACHQLFRVSEALNQAVDALCLQTAEACMRAFH